MPKIKQLDQMPKIVYHGSTTEHQESLRNISVNKGRIKIDFGQGFYTTSIKDQAISWAEGKSYSQYKPLMLTYEIDFDIIKLLKGIKFVFPNDKWARIIYNNRIGLANPLGGFDYAYGHLADGVMTTLLEEIESGIKSFDDFKKEIIPDCNEFYYDQLVLKTARSIKMINQINEEVL